MASVIVNDNILAECDYIDIDIYDNTLVVSTNKDCNYRVLFYKLND